MDHARAGHDEVRSALRGIPIFSELTEDLREEIIAESSLLRLPAGEWLFRQDDAGDALYVVCSGRIEVVRERPAPTSVLRVLGRGAAVGELALLTDSPRSASARGIRDSDILRVGREQVMGLLHESPAFAIALTRVLGRLLQASGGAPEARRPRVAVIAVVPAHRGVEVGAFAGELRRAMAHSGSVALLGHDAIEGAEEDGGAFAEHGRLLDLHERDHDHVLLVGAEDGDPRWNAFCRRQADRVVAVAVPGASSASAEPRTPEEAADLVIWGPSDMGVRHVHALLERVRPARHHFVAGEAGVARLARRLLGRSVGVVLSGGGAGGLAHVGVLDVLVGSGLAIDRVGGCSFGSFVGGLLAMGKSPAEIIEVCREHLVRQNAFNDYVVPRHSLIRGRKGRAMLHRALGEVAIEQLPLDFYCVSSDLLSAEVIVHRRGSLAEAVRASASIPGLGPPVRRDGRLLVDGGVLNNFPVDIMLRTGEGPVVGVDVMGRRMHRPAATAWGEPTGVEVYRAPRPNIYEVLSRATALGSWQAAERVRTRADVVIAPDLTGTGMFDFKRMDAIVEAGREAARAALEEAPHLVA